VDEVLFTYTVPSNSLPLSTNYNLITQKYLIADSRERLNSINGIGPMGQVRDNISFTAFYNDFDVTEMIQDPVEPIWHKFDSTKKGSLIFATNRNLISFTDFQKPRMLPNEILFRALPLPDTNPISCDIAPYLSKPVMPPKRLNYRGEEEI